jgi:hypothetical protein
MLASVAIVFALVVIGCSDCHRSCGLAIRRSCGLSSVAIMSASVV